MLRYCGRARAVAVSAFGLPLALARGAVGGLAARPRPLRVLGNLRARVYALLFFRKNDQFFRKKEQRFSEINSYLCDG